MCDIKLFLGHINWVLFLGGGGVIHHHPPLPSLNSLLISLSIFHFFFLRVSSPKSNIFSRAVSWFQKWEGGKVLCVGGKTGVARAGWFKKKIKFWRGRANGGKAFGVEGGQMHAYAPPLPPPPPPPLPIGTATASFICSLSPSPGT